MLTKPLGNTSTAIPVIGLGTGDFFWDADVPRPEIVSFIQESIDAGVTLIDTAEEYGAGESEKLVGAAICGRREDVLLASKFSPNNARYQDVLTSAENSLRRLGTDHLDIYQLHWPNPAVPLSETMLALAKLIDDGKVRNVGLCNSSRMHLIEANKYLGDSTVASLQVEYNLFERTIEYSGLLDFCEENEITVMAYSPLDQGRFASAEPEQLEVLRRISSAHDCSVAQLMLAWLVAHPVVTAIVRTLNSTHLKDNSRADQIDLSAAEQKEISDTFPIDVIQVPTDQIRVSTSGEWNHQVYQSLEEAIDNKLGYVPSPVDLAEEVKAGEFLKPVRLVKSPDPAYKYDLIGGRIRYWAWVIAFDGQVPINAQIRAGL